ncbi:hypothetical protein N875_06355 [Neisseria meningitidis LNP21362]|uniref:DUF4177 domain-containing protein n=5 Tax=Neisseria TaxID=482 RepID=Q9JXC0_NEIMB|nr:hypothetical protein NMB2130 [Neisseria meningitidis MC58]AJC63258.1 hypothetical protein N875_06355 [Neisseria meningitidis LNP21362]
MIPYVKRNPMKEYKVIIYQESLLSSLFFGAAKVNPIKFSEFLNKQTPEGWRVVTMEKDLRRMLLFFKREAYVVILERDRV